MAHHWHKTKGFEVKMHCIQANDKMHLNSCEVWLLFITLGEMDLVDTKYFIRIFVVFKKLF